MKCSMSQLLKVSILSLSIVVVLAGCGGNGDTSQPKSSSSEDQDTSNYPEKTIHMITPTGSGGGTDVAARKLAKSAKQFFDQDLVVTNKPGGSTTLGTAYVADKKPDGYTVLFAPSGPLVSQPHLLENIDYKRNDFRGVINVTSQPIVLAVRADSPWKSLEDLKNADKVIKGGNAGKSTIPGLVMSGFFGQADLENRVVPFKGGGKAVEGLLSDSVQVITALPVEVQPYVESGKVRILAVSSAKRNPTFPDVPTLKEQGINLVIQLNDFILVPDGTPDNVVTYLHDKFKEAAESEEFQKFAKNTGQTANILNGKETMELIKEDYDTIGEIIKNNPVKKK